MDLVSSLIGFLIGAIVAGIIGWKIGNARVNSKTKQLSATENEIKQLISQQAKQHIETTKSAVENMQSQLSAIQEQLAGFESGLSTQQLSKQNDNFYGEHASLFLRNTNNKLSKADKARGDNQPRDFSSQSSGLFVGNVAEKEKSK